jgi:hypothetical protein
MLNEYITKLLAKMFDLEYFIDFCNFVLSSCIQTMTMLHTYLLLFCAYKAFKDKKLKSLNI